ncbi:hypothetical protein IMZ29_12990 [Achromobacter sp. GG226]|uniref:YciI family protein n=1 Tax=Verticiella alkaliphila TaxID=2779529 RepID=UPI001C0D08E7|nr:YciI family protein [Verticiella sp. GG226]MBU4611410.1 hypothetical protein [Verticiella sp. GG226]
MLYVIRFYDIADGLAIRQAHIDAHMAWLAEQGPAIVAAGPLRVGGPDTKPVGALWIVQADSEAQAEAIVRTDPFSIHGLRERIEVYAWSRGYPAQPVTI